MKMQEKFINEQKFCVAEKKAGKPLLKRGKFTGILYCNKTLPLDSLRN